MNDPGLITLVNKLQDVFTTVGVRGDFLLILLIRVQAAIGHSIHVY